MNKVLGLLIALTSVNAMAYEISDLNGTWKARPCGVGATIKISVPDGATTEMNQPVNVAASSRYLLFLRASISCQVTKIAENKFESFCQSQGVYDHTYIEFVDENSYLETDLSHGCGVTLTKRVK